MRNNRVSAVDGILQHFLKECGLICTSGPCSPMRTVYDYEQRYDNLKHDPIINTYKRADRCNCERRTAYLPTIRRIRASVVRNRLPTIAEVVVPELQSGFGSTTETTDMISNRAAPRKKPLTAKPASPDISSPTENLQFDQSSSTRKSLER